MALENPKTKPARAPRPPRPGGPSGNPVQARVRDMVRVDHAGEVAAVAIYQAQQRVFGALGHKRALVRSLHEMEMAEHAHLDAFNRQLHQRLARPTALIGLWQPLSYALGTITALIGQSSAHACTEAVEDVIEAHYQDQIDELEATRSEPELVAMFTAFRQDELGHRDKAVEQGAREAPAHGLLSGVIKTGCRAAIALSDKI